jgi:VanZ family protein
MVVIFIASSTPSREMPDFGFWDTVVKKSGHIIGYGLLALCFWFAFRWKKRVVWLPLLLTVIYAITDEFHQSFIPGRNASLMDVLYFDTTGACLALGLAWLRIKKGK